MTPLVVVRIEVTETEGVTLTVERNGGPNDGGSRTKRYTNAEFAPVLEALTELLNSCHQCHPTRRALASFRDSPHRHQQQGDVR